ncbi:DUF922 domain-containing protein [Flavivirga aquatica]|uniref:DUF922 domain-containing protein n=1 Tax=Flavivirga aquatica TaxID=1849968 RepID=A0A1E5T8N1_9FLAO|nr:DUF922 domain-containing protein [Flavivirga aquatica]OEK07731.1 DUF922 domain-containing protein [Flavivirga aquatica]
MFCFLSVQDEPVLSWNTSRKLSWVDFKAKPDNSSSAVAITASGITFGYSIKKSSTKVLSFTSEVYAYFYPEDSWYKTEQVNDHILGHEQLHFDITELYARKFRQRISRLKVSNNVKKELQGIHNTINKEVSLMQDNYDDETNYSRNIEAQAKWKLYIRTELKKLSKYKSVN